VINFKLGDCAVASTDEKITVGQELHAVDTLGEESVSGSNSLKETALKINLDNITSQCTHVSARVIWRNNDALVNSLDCAHCEVLEEDLFLDIVDVPDADTIVVDCHKVIVCVVEEGNFVSDVHANSMATDGFSTFGIPDNELVIILAA